MVFMIAHGEVMAEKAAPWVDEMVADDEMQRFLRTGVTFGKSTA